MWADDLLIAIQMKERERDLPEANWFEDKVLKKATKQVRDTLKFLGEYGSILIENQRGHRFHLEPAKLKRKFLVVVYDEPASIVYRARPNHYVSKTAGLIHVVRSTDLLDVCRTLITLSEIASYLDFRANIVRLNSLLSERAILGQFLRGAVNELPDERNVEEFSRFRRNRSRFDIRWFFEELPSVIHTNHNGDDKSYYGILREFVLLDRFELEQVRIRIGIVNDSLQHSANHPPVVMATQRGTVTMTGSADLKSQCALRIGLGVASEADARLIIPDDVRIAADLARLRYPGTGIVQMGKQGRVLPVKFYRIEYDEIGQIAERYGHIRPAPDRLLADALGEDYASRWRRAASIPGVARRAMGPAGAPADQGHPDRRRATGMLRSAGVKGMTVRAIAEQLAAAGRPVAHQTVQRWLTEEAAAGRVENASYGRWKWRGDRPA